MKPTSSSVDCIGKGHNEPHLLNYRLDFSIGRPADGPSGQVFKKGFSREK